ncbi:outer membrane beta-barrel protein [Cryomorphaceae bacterium 1068]|nr:outer membrane beta-barrel protein [Cryomorphaceae bacterium 1068]
MKKQHFILILSIFLVGMAKAQVDTTQPDNTTVQEPKSQNNNQGTKRASSDFKIYGGLSVSTIILSGSDAEAAFSSGYALGASYRKGKYSYWEIGANYNGSVVGFEDALRTDKTLEFRQLNFPVTVGLNILGGTGRVLGVRAFGGVVPGVITEVLSNPFQLSKNDFNEFQMGGRLGVGVDVLFLFVEMDYTYGFLDMLQDQGSNLSQVNFLVGFRF